MSYPSDHLSETTNSSFTPHSPTPAKAPRGTPPAPSADSPTPPCAKPNTATGSASVVKTFENVMPTDIASEAKKAKTSKLLSRSQSGKKRGPSDTLSKDPGTGSPESSKKPGCKERGSDNSRKKQATLAATGEGNLKFMSQEGAPHACHAPLDEIDICAKILDLPFVSERDLAGPEAERRDLSPGQKFGWKSSLLNSLSQSRSKTDDGAPPTSSPMHSFSAGSRLTRSPMVVTPVGANRTASGPTIRTPDNIVHYFCDECNRVFRTGNMVANSVCGTCGRFCKCNKCNSPL